MAGRGWCALAALVSATLLAGCAGGPAPRQADTGDRVTARLQKDSSAGAVRYDRNAGTCSDGSTPLLTREAYAALVEGWKAADACTSPTLRSLPSATGYPVVDGRQVTGSAHVLVQVGADARVGDVRAVCATSPAFGAAAEDTMRSIAFTPGSCDGVPTRMAVMVPLDFDPD